jgi:hypothetical protein
VRYRRAFSDARLAACTTPQAAGRLADAMFAIVVSFVCTSHTSPGPGTAAHWEAQPPVVAQGAAAALRTRPLPQPTASSLVVASFFFIPLTSPLAYIAGSARWFKLGSPSWLS